LRCRTCEEEVREVVFGEHGSQNDLRRLKLTLIIIPTELHRSITNRM
jgi:hypothetical protein